MTAGDTYIVRVYRRAPSGEVLRGVVEIVGYPGERFFSSRDELWVLLRANVTLPSISSEHSKEGERE